MLSIALENSRNTTLTTREKWVRVTGYLASCINILLNDVDLGNMARNIEAVKQYQKEKLELAKEQRKHRPVVSRRRSKRDDGPGEAEDPEQPVKVLP